MSTTLDGVNIVYVRVDVLRVIGVVHDCNLDWNSSLLSLQIDDIIKQVCAMAIHVANELLQSILSVEHLCLRLPVLWNIAILIRLWAKVCQGNLDASIEESKLTHTAGYYLVLICRCGEDASIRPELLASTALVCLADNLHIIERLTLLVFLLIDLAIAENL